MVNLRNLRNMRNLRLLLLAKLALFTFSCAEEQADDVTQDLEYLFYCFVHNFDVLNGE